VGRENIFIPTIENESLHQVSNDNGVKIIKALTHKKIWLLRARCFRNKNILKYTWTSPAGKTHIQIDHILIDRRWHSSILDVQSFREADCDADHYLVVARVRERLAVSKKSNREF